MRYMHPQATLSIAAQVAGLRSHFPSGKTTWDRFKLNWRGILSPSGFGRNYEVELTYTISASPQVWVRDPNLNELAGGRPLPHTYDQQAQRLCLYPPGRKFWRPDRALAVTLIPWACLWLYYFELWLFTDEWSGTGEHPPAAREIQQQAAPTRRAVILF